MAEENRIATHEWLYQNLLPYKKVANPPNDKQGCSKSRLISNYNVDETLLTTYDNNRLVPRGKCVGLLTNRFNREYYMNIGYQSNGKIIVMGEFDNYNNKPNTNQIVRLNSDLTIDSSFISPSDYSDQSGGYHLMQVQKDDKILMSIKNRTVYNGVPCKQLIRLNGDGSVDTAFTNNAYNLQITHEISSIFLQDDGKIIIASNKIERLNSDGTIDPTFTPFNIVGTILSITNYNNNFVVAVGSFKILGSSISQMIVGLTNTGTLDNSFNVGTGFYINNDPINLNYTPYKIINYNNNLYITGSMIVYKGKACRQYIKLDYNGNIDDLFSEPNLIVLTDDIFYFYQDFNSNLHLLSTREKGIIFTDNNGKKLIKTNNNILGDGIIKIHDKYYIVGRTSAELGENKKGICIYDPINNTFI